MKNFRKELQTLINKNSLENGSDTPDFILADYLKMCLETFDKTVQAREQWYGRNLKRTDVELTTTRTPTRKLIDLIVRYNNLEPEMLTQNETDIGQKFKIEKDGKEATRALIDCVIAWEKDPTPSASLETILKQQFTITEKEPDPLCHN